MAPLWCLRGMALAAGLGLAAAGAAAGQLPMTAGPGRGNPLTEEFGGYVRRKLDEWRVPGMSLAVIEGEDIYAEGYGLATLPARRATAETLWFGASTTKAQVAAALGRLIDSGAHPELARGWSTPLAAVIRDDFVLGDGWATDHVTLEDAASHRSGLPRHDKAAARVVNGTRVTARDVVRNLRNLPMAAEPRAVFQYCNLMYVALGHVLETVTRGRLAAVLRDALWAPLGMNSTYLGLDEARAAPAPAHLATGYYWDRRAGAFVEVEHMSLEELAAAGGVVSTAVDYARWVRCLLHEAAPLSRRVHRDIKKPRMLRTASAEGGLDVVLYSLGWQRQHYKGHAVFVHDGGLDAFGAQVYWIPDADFGVVAFANTAVTSNAVEDVVIYRLIDDRLGIPEPERFDVDARWRDQIKRATDRPEDVDDILFPDRPDPPLPSTFTVDELVGRYSDPGYGEFTLRQAAHPDRPGDRILVADRDNMSWRYRLSLHHVSGDYWTVYVTTPRNPTFMNEFQPAEFTRGVNGKVSGLNIRWSSRIDGITEGSAAFKRLP